MCNLHLGLQIMQVSWNLYFPVEHRVIALCTLLQDKGVLQDRLETAINNAEGFGLR